MSLGGKIMEIFGSTAAPANPAVNTTVNSTQARDANATIPNSNTPVSDGSIRSVPVVDATKSPMADYKDLFKKADTDKDISTGVPAFNLDPKVMMEKSKNIDFLQSVNKDNLAKAAKGDVEALAAVISEAGQTGFAMNTAATGSIVEEALKRQAQSFRDEIFPELLRRHEASTSLRDSNDAFNNPAVSPVVNLLERQLAIKHPDATPGQLTKMAQDYLKETSNLVVTGAGGTVAYKSDTVAEKKNDPKLQTGRAGDDWSGFFNQAH